MIKLSIIFTHESGGRLVLSQCPGKNLKKGRDGKSHARDIAQDLTSFRERGIHIIVCLLNDYELRTIGVAPNQYREAAGSLGLLFIQYPIIEMAAPDSLDSLSQCVINPLFAEIAQGKSAVIHCRGGIGRAGTVAACMLKRMQLAEDHTQAIKYIRKKRDKRCIESRRQEDFVKLFFATETS